MIHKMSTTWAVLWPASSRTKPRESIISNLRKKTNSAQLQHSGERGDFVMQFYLFLISWVFAFLASGKMTSGKSPSDTSPSMSKPPFKTIQNLVDAKWGYTLEERPSSKATGDKIFRVLHPEYKDPYEIGVATFRYNDDGDTSSLGIPSAFNGEDDRPRHAKLPLRDMAMGFWKFHLGREPRDLKRLRYFAVLEDNLSALIPTVYELCKADPETDLTISSSSSKNPDEQKAFGLILNQTPFGNGAAKMIREYEELAGVQIDSFQFLYGSSQFPDFQVNFM